MSDTTTAPRLTTTEIADLIGIDCHTLSASITKLWWSYLEGQEAQVGNGRRRSYTPVDAVVIEMLVSTGELGGELVNTVREQLAEQIYDLAVFSCDIPATEQIVLTLADGQIDLAFRPAWFLIGRAQHQAKAAAGDV